MKSCLNNGGGLHQRRPEAARVPVGLCAVAGSNHVPFPRNIYATNYKASQDHSIGFRRLGDDWSLDGKAPMAGN